MKTVTVKNSWLSESGLRLDASYHLSDGVNTKRIIDNKCPYPTVALSEEADELYKGNIHKRVYVTSPEHGHMFYTASDMFRSDIDSGKYISKKYSPHLDDLELKKDWILITRSGTLGKVVYVTDDYVGKIGTDDLVRIKPAEKQIKRGYLYAFLSSKYGYGLITQSGYGGVVKHIEPHHIENLKIPVLPEDKQQRIHNLILDSANLRVESNRFLKEATDYFDAKFGVEDISNVFSKSINDVGFSWAAYNNNLECDKIVSKLDESYSIRDVATKCFAPPMFKHIYLDKDNGHPFLTGGELTKVIKKYYRWLSPRGVKNIEDYKVKKGTLLLYKSGNTDGGILGNAFITDDVLHNACLSDHVIRIFTDNINMSYWLFAFLKSSSGVRLLKKTATGSMIPFITPERLLDINFPKPDDKFDWIADKIENYISKSVQSQLNELEAINLIENEIESWQTS